MLRLQTTIDHHFLIKDEDCHPEFQIILKDAEKREKFRMQISFGKGARPSTVKTNIWTTVVDTVRYYVFRGFGLF